MQYMVHDNQTELVSEGGKWDEDRSPSGVCSGKRFFRVIVVHEGLLNVEVRGQVVLVQLHM